MKLQRSWKVSSGRPEYAYQAHLMVGDEVAGTVLRTVGSNRFVAWASVSQRLGDYKRAEHAKQACEAHVHEIWTLAGVVYCNGRQNREQMIEALRAMRAR